MRPITRTEEPKCLSKYRKRRPKAKWDDFKNKKNRLKLLREAVERMQNGLCAYCEMDLTENDHHIEHFFPKGKSTKDYNAHLDWENLLCSCKAGIIAKTAKGDISCGQKKGGTIVDSELSPTRWKYPLVKAVEIPDGLSADEALKDGEFFAKNIVEIIPSGKNCKKAGIGTDKVQNFIEVVNLNCNRLKELRGAHINEIALKADTTPDAEIPSLLQEYLLPNAEGKLRRFWTTSRSFFGAAGEKVGIADEDNRRNLNLQRRKNAANLH